MPPTERPLRAVFFDAGNTLLQMNYTVIAPELMRHGVRVAPEKVQRAEWRARVRLDEDVFARATPGDSTESRSSAGRYLRYVLEELGVADAATIEQVAEWRRTYNLPVGVWNTPDPRRTRRSRSCGGRGSGRRSSRTPTARSGPSWIHLD